VKQAKLDRIIIAYRDRLVRFGFDFFHWLFTKHGADIIVVNNLEEQPNSRSEIIDDFVAIIHYFAMKLYGARTYKRKVSQMQNIVQELSMKLQRTTTFRINFSPIQNAYFTIIAKQYKFCLQMLTEYLYDYGQLFDIDTVAEEFDRIRTKELSYYNFSSLVKFPKRLFTTIFRRMPTTIAQNVLREAVALSKARLFKPQDEYHFNITSPYFTVSSVKLSNDGIYTFPNSKYLKKLFNTTRVQLQVPKQLLEHLRNDPTLKKFYFRIRWSCGKWYCDIIKTLNAKHEKTSRTFAAIDLNMSDIAFIDEVTKQPILLSLKNILYRAIKLFNKYSKAQSKGDQKRANRYRRSISVLFRNQLRLYAIRIIQWCYQHGINRIAVGSVRPVMLRKTLSRNIRKIWNFIPWTYFFDYLKSYGERYDVYAYHVNEAYTSKASALDNDPLPEKREQAVNVQFSGQRISRGLYQTNDTVIHADVNGAANILRRAASRFGKTISFTKHQLSTVRRVGYQLLNNVSLFAAVQLKRFKDKLASAGYSDIVTLAKSIHFCSAYYDDIRIYGYI